MKTREDYDTTEEWIAHLEGWREGLRERVRLAEEHAGSLQQTLGTVAAMGSEYKHALEHVASCGGTCHDCRQLAKSALAHENLDDFRDTVP